MLLKEFSDLRSPDAYVAPIIFLQSGPGLVRIQVTGRESLGKLNLTVLFTEFLSSNLS